MNAIVIQKAYHRDDSRKSAAIIEMDGIRFFSVTPGSADEADKINFVFRNAVIRPKALTFTKTKAR